VNKDVAVVLATTIMITQLLFKKVIKCSDILECSDNALEPEMIDTGKLSIHPKNLTMDV